MRNIIFIISSLSSGGAERVMSIIVNNLSELGYDISIIVKQGNKPFYQINDKVKIIYPKHKIKYNTLYSKVVGRAKVYRDIYLIIKRNKPDLVISFSTTTNASVIIICKILKIKVIVSEHNNYKIGLDNIFIMFIKKYIYKFSDKVTVLTKRDDVEYYGKFLNNVVVMPNPLSFLPVEKKIYNNKNIILAIGNLDRWKHKGFDKLIYLYSKIYQYYPGWKLYIVGGGSGKYLKSLIELYAISDNVFLIGETTDVVEIMHLSTIFVMTSRWEGLPMVLIEAMSQGLPCIAFDCFTGPGDIITNNVDGLLVEDQNDEEFERKLIELIENRQLQEELSVNAIETSKKYSYHIIINKWIELIEMVCCK